MYRRESSSRHLLLQLTGILAAILAGHVHVNAQTGSDGFATCASNIYRCFSSTLLLSSSQLQPALCSSNDSCVVTAAATCPAAYALAGQELARAAYDLYRASCDQKYCFDPLEICVGNPFLTGYTNNNFGPYCRSYSTAAESCRTPDCANLDAVTSWKADLASLCVSGGECYQAAVTCISYAYFDPRVQDLNIICMNVSSASSCITNILSSASCTGASASITTAVNNLLQGYLTKCADDHVCNQTLESCLSAVVSTDISSNHFASLVCSNLASIQTCLSAYTACQARFATFIAQMQQYCAPQLCAAGVQYCYNSVAFNASLLQTWTVSAYLQSWCTAASTIQTCLSNHNTLCNVIGYDFQATVGVSLNSLCTLGQSANAADATCYWNAINCLYANGVVQYGTPTAFWVPSSTDYCQAVSYNATSSCLSTARSQCSGASAATYQQTIDSVIFAFTTSCTPACSTTGKQVCQDALTYYLTQMLNGSTNLCSLLSQPHTCYGMQIKDCTTLTSAVQASNVAILNSLFVSLSQICSSLTPPNGTNTCLSGVVQCLVTFFGGITGNTNFNTQSDICQNWTTTTTCIAAAQSTCTGSITVAISSIIQAVNTVLSSLKPCNPATTCDLQTSLTCQATLTSEIEIASGYSFPVDYLGNPRDVFCRKDLDGSAAISSGFQGDDDDLSPSLVCSYPKFYWGALCVNINATLECVGQATLNCSGAIQLSQQASLQQSAAAYISSCSGIYLCQYDTAVTAVQDLVKFGLQSQFRNVRNQKDNFCYWLSEISLSIWNSGSQCTPFVSQYFWQFVEAYLEVVTVNCKPRQIICSRGCPPPRTSWTTPLPPDCSMASIQDAFMSFFEVIWTESISVTPDVNVIASSLVTLQTTLQIIQTADVNYAQGSCQWVADFTSVIIVNFQTTIDIIVSPPTCFISDAFDCVAGLQKFITKKGLTGAGNLNGKKRDLFCRAATRTFTCIASATASCTASQQQVVYDDYYALQDLVGYICRDRCTSDPCQNDGLCSTAVSTGTVTPPASCQCSPGYSGKNCEISSCSYPDLLACINPVINILLSGDISGLSSALTNAITCLNNLDDDCQYDFSFEITLEIIIKLNSTLTVTTSGCSASAVNTCLRPPNLRLPPKLFDPKTKFLSSDVCSQWSAVLSCLQAAGCTVTQIDSVSTYFAAGCAAPPPSTCPVRDVAEKVNRCGRKFNKVKNAKPRPKKKVKNPKKELGRCRKEYKPENEPPENENQLDDNGLNLNLDVCGEVGDSWSDANKTVSQCAKSWSDMVNGFLTSQAARFTGNGQCDSPCDTAKCAYGSTCVPNVNPPVGYTCACLPGWSGQYCDVAPTPTCQTKDCPKKFLDIVSQVVNGSLSPALCGQLSAVSQCLSTDLYPCGDNYAADATLMIQFISFVSSTLCVTPPPETCEVQFLAGCLETLITNVYENVEVDDNQCIYRQASAYCLTLYQVKCSGNGFVDILFDLSTAAVSQYVTSCEPSDCNVDAVINCLTPLQQAAAFQLLPSGSDTCSVAATAASCVKQVSSNCPPWLTTQINSLLSSLLSAANSGQPAPSVPGGSGDICATNPCQNGGTCSIDPSSPYKFTCACVEGFKGDFCHYLGCSQSNVSLCVALLLPVFNVPWENGCPTVDCSLLSAAFACLSAVTRSCPTRTNQVGQLANMINVVQQQLCNAPAACGPQPATCPTSQIRECLLQSINVAFIINVSDQELALEVGMPFRSLGGDASSVACVNKYVDTANPACTNDFENALGSLLTAVNPSYLIGSCNIKSLETYKTYIPATVTTMKAQPNLPYVVQQALCTNMHDLLVAADTSITSCEISGDESFTADAITERGNYNTNYQLYESVCALQGCTPNPCQNGGVCVPQPGGGFTCSCPRGISGDTCENGQPSCTYNKALACFQTIRTIVDSCIGISNNNTLCQAISQTRDCIAATTVNCDDELIVKLNTELNVIQSKLSLSCYSPCDTKVCGYTSGCTVGPTAGTYTCSCAFGFKGPDCLTDACDYSAVTQCTVNAFGQVMDGTFCPNGLATAVSCINAYTDCSVAYRSTAITIVTDFDTTLCRAPNCSLATVKAQCLSLFPTDAAIWDAVKESFGASYCSASIVSKVFECLANLRTCEVSASFSAIVKYVCPKDPLPLISSNCSLTVITDELTTLQSSLDQAKKKSQQPSSSSSTSSSSSSNSCNDPPPARSVTVNYYKSGMLCIDGTVQTLQNANSWTKSDTVTLPESPKVIGIRGSRTPCKKAGMIAAATNDYFVTDSKWKCSACSETATDFCAVDFDDKLWSPAVVLKPFIGSGRQIDGLDPSTSANFIWTDTTTSIDKTVCCRLKAITPLVLSLYSECDYRVYIDGTLQQNPAVPDSTATFTIPSTASLISVELGENCCCGFIASATGDAILSDNTWKCSEQLPTGWTSTPQSDWPSAVADTANDDPTDSHGVSLNAKWTSTGTGTVNRFGCQKQFTQPAAYPVQTTNKQCDSQPAVPDDGSNPCWYVQLSYSSVQSIIGGCSSSLDAQYSSLVTSLLANYSVSSTCSNQCADNPCLNQATCVPSQFSFKCQCQPGYSGALCEKGGQCSLQSTQDCLTRLTVLSKAIVDNATLLLLPDTITQLQSILLCLSVNQQPCGPQDSYVYRVIVVYINYLIEQSVSVVPTVSCDYKAFISCTLRLTSDIYLSSTGLSVSLQTMLQCLTTISSSCGQVSLPIDEVIWLTWQTINIVFPDPTCSLSVALACTEDISVAFANDPTSSSAVCLYYSDTITCINNAVASCPGSAISDRIVATVLDSIQAVSVLCINACDGYPCFHGGVCTQVGATPYCTCPSGWAGSRCEQPSGCQLDALSACLEEGFALIALALTDPCSPIDCSSPTGVVGRLRVCLETNVLQCDHAIIVQINQLKAALALLVTLPGVCAASPPPNCVPVIPPIQCDWQTVTAQIVTMVQTAFSQLSAFPGPDLNLLCTVTNQTKVIITNRECQVPGLQTILQGVETWISTVINTTCSPVCPASGSLPQASSCLAQLKQLVDSVLNATVLSLTAQNSFCGDVWLSGSCVQSSVDFCSDLTIQTEYAEYTASVSVICPLPCQFDVCQPGSICVPDPNSPFGFLCQCPPGSIDVNCQIQPSCDISEVAQCIQPVQDLMTTGGGSLSLPRTTFCDALKEATDCLNALRLNCTDTVFDPVFNKFYKTLDAFQRSLQFVCTKPCDSSPCYNDATCVDNDSSNSFSCVCPPKFSGPTCQEQLCSEADINACFDDVLIAFFTSPGESLCQVIAAVHTCLVTTTATCSDSISSVYFSIEANLTAYLSVACSFTPPKYLGCPLLALSSCPSADLIALLDGSTDGLTALQLTTVCSDFNAFVECASAISSDCTSVALAVGSVLSTVCTVPPDPQCSVKVAINALFEFASYALTAQQSWSRGDRYGGETRDRYWSRKNKTAKVDHWIPRPIDYVFTDGPIYACWHLDTLKVTITTSISSCLIASIVENITATLTAYEVQFLSDGACSYPCDGDPCVAGGVCSVVGLGFDCQCAPGYSGDYCDIGANCNYQAAYTDWNIFDALLNGGVISLGQFLNAGGGDAWSTLQQTFYVSLLPCPDDGNQSTAIEILITIISEIITQTIDCDVDGAFQCAASFLVAMQPPLGSNSPPDASQLCLLLQTLYDCALNVRISCSLPAIDFRQPPEVLPISTQLAQQAFIASQAVCDITLCQVSVAKQCLLTLYDIIATNGPDLCTLVFTQKECISVAIASCPAFVAVDIQASVTSALSGVPCLSPCSTEPCLNGGTCIEMSPTTYDCQCTSQFTGDRCQTNVGCDVSSVETCVGASLQQIVYAFLDPCNNAIACSLIDDLVLCLRSKTVLCDNATQGYFESAIGAFLSIRFVCDVRTAPTGCDSNDCSQSYQSLRALILGFLSNFFDQLTQPQGPNFHLVCSSWESIKSQLITICPVGSFRSTVSRSLSWIQNVTSSVCTVPICSAPSALGCLSYLNTYLAQVQARPDVLPSDLNDFCSVAQSSYDCVIGNLAQCSADDPTRISILSQWNMTFTTILSSGLCTLPCVVNPCLNDGTCVQISATNFTCSCDSRHAGQLCQYAALYPYDNSTGLTCQTNVYNPSLSFNIILSLPIQLFCQSFSNIFVSQSGYVTLDSNTPILSFLQFCPSARSILAPLFAWQDCSCAGSAVYYNHYSTDTLTSSDSLGANIIGRATEQVRQYSSDATFSATTVVVVTWNNVFPYPCNYYKTQYGLTTGSTYQLVIIADLLTTYAVYNYDSLNINVLVPAVYTGQNVNGQCTIGWNPKSISSPDILSVTPPVTNLPGQWFYQLFNSSATCPPPPPQLQCLAYVRKTIDLTQYSLQACPCNGRLAASDPRFRFTYIDWFRYCFSYNIPSQAASGLSFTQTCCYSPTNSALFTNPPYAGFPTVSGGSVSDTQIYAACCINSNTYCNLFLALRPIDKCNTYTGPAQALIWGDPHFYTVDGLAFTFNGIGDYVMTKTRTSSYVFQARTAQFSDTTGRLFNASGFVAFAAQEFASKIEVYMNAARNGLVVYYNGLQYSQNSLIVPSIYIAQTATAVNVTFPSGWTLNIGLAFRFLSVVQTLPLVAWNNTQGLLGLYNGVASDDLMAPDGTVLPPTATLRSIHYNLGLLWQVQASDSLFTSNVARVTANPDFLPVFDSPCATAADDTAAKSLCGSSLNCYYDYCVTLNSEIASSTLAAETSYNMSRQILASLAPTLSIVELQSYFNLTGQWLLNATVNRPLTLTLRAVSTVSGVTVAVQMVGTIASQATANLNPTTGVFTWTPTSLDPVDVSFVAIDSNGGVSPELQVTVRLCGGCSGHGTCDYTRYQYVGTGVNFQLTSCTCDVGWNNNTGGECASPFNACVLNPCGVGSGAVCTPYTPEQQQTTQQAFSCASCLPGYALPLCIDINECAQTSPPVCNQICNNTQGSYTCSCRSGYVLENQTTCKDIDECSLRTFAALCGQICVNTPGSYQCACQAGYRLASDGINCEDINECTERTALCNQGCNNLPGSYECTCSPNYRLVGPYRCVALPLEATIRFRFSVPWDPSYLDQRSTAFIRLKNTIEPALLKIIRGAVSVLLTRCFQSSVGADVVVGFNDTVTPAVASNISASIGANLGSSGYSLVAPDGTVFPVLSSPEVIVNNATVDTSYNPCTDYKLCQNGGVCQSPSVNGVYAAPTCSCNGSYTGQYCEQNTAQASTTTTPQPTTSINIMSVVLGVSIPLAIFLLALLGLLIYKGVVQPRQAKNYWSDLSSPRESLGLEGKRSLRMHRFWPLKPRST